MSTGTLKIAYLAEGKLYVKTGATAPQLIESTFAQKTVDRATQSAERHGWRNKNAPGGSPFGKSMIWGGAARMPEVRKVQITGLTRSPEPGNLLYALDTGAIGGLFTYDLKDNYENRLFHRQEFRANDLAHHPTKPLVALSLPNEDGTAGIAIMQPGGRGLRPITEGDALDQAPSWVPTPDDPNREVLIYQSHSGLARNERGHITGQGPYAIPRLDMDNVKQTTVLEDPKFTISSSRASVSKMARNPLFHPPPLQSRRPHRLHSAPNCSPISSFSPSASIPRLHLRIPQFLLPHVLPQTPHHRRRPKPEPWTPATSCSTANGSTPKKPSKPPTKANPPPSSPPPGNSSA